MSKLPAGTAGAATVLIIGTCGVAGYAVVRAGRVAGQPSRPSLPGCLCGQHHHGEGACIIDRPALRRWDWYMSAVRLALRTGLRVRGPGGVVR